MCYIIRKNRIESATLVKKGSEKSLVKFKNDEILLDNGFIHLSRNQAGMSLQESKLIKKFKQDNVNKNGYGYCSYCKRRMHKDSSTVDHVRPLKSFGGRKKIRENKEVWETAWDIDNLVLACQECNSEKDNLNVKYFTDKLTVLDKKARILNMKKAKKGSIRTIGTRLNNKVGFGVSTASDKHNYFSAMYTARADSNILNKELILGKMV